MHHPTHRIIHTTAFVATVVGHWLEQNLSGSILSDKTISGKQKKYISAQGIVQRMFEANTSMTSYIIYRQ